MQRFFYQRAFPNFPLFQILPQIQLFFPLYREIIPNLLQAISPMEKWGKANLFSKKTDQKTPMDVYEDGRIIRYSLLITTIYFS